MNEEIKNLWKNEDAAFAHASHQTLNVTEKLRWANKDYIAIT